MVEGLQVVFDGGVVCIDDVQVWFGFDDVDVCQCDVYVGQVCVWWCGEDQFVIVVIGQQVGVL